MIHDPEQANLIAAPAILRRPEWSLAERDCVGESTFLNRRQLLRGFGLGAIASVTTGGGLLGTTGPVRAETDPSVSLYPVPRNNTYKNDRPITPEKISTRYNNFYEFGSSKQIYAAAQALKIRPWEIAIDGEVEKPLTLAIDDLLAKMPLEERIYRHRCVEAWSMVVPWSGFALSELVKLANPNSEAKFIRFETFNDKEVASGQRQYWYPWPYSEGITMDEAMNELAFMVTGAYEKPLPKQMGAPLRLALPWKYGFKSIKSIRRISFVKEQPVSFWQELAPAEYGFWANVNPEVPHARWSQATERNIATGDRQPTQIFNGYGQQVAGLYKDKQDLALYM